MGDHVKVGETLGKVKDVVGYVVNTLGKSRML
jgi:hypothetical protein